MGLIFLCLFLNGAQERSRIKTHNSVDEGGNNAHQGKKIGGAESESKNYIGVFGVQAAQLQLYEEQEERPRQT